MKILLEMYMFPWISVKAKIIPSTGIYWNRDLLMGEIVTSAKE